MVEVQTRLAQVPVFTGVKDRLQLSELLTQLTLPTSAFSEKDSRSIFSSLLELSLSQSSDKVLRKRCLRCGLRLCQMYPAAMSQELIAYVQNVRKGGHLCLAGPDLLVLFMWSSMAKRTLVPASKEDIEMCFLQANCMTQCQKQATRPSIKRAAERHYRASVYDTFDRAESPSQALETYLQTILTSEHDARSLLPLFATIIRGLRSTDAAMVTTLSSYKGRLLELYVQQVFMRSYHINKDEIVCWTPFLAYTIEAIDLVDVVIPAVLKALLRSPEHVLAPGLANLVYCSGKSACLKVLVESLTKPLLNATSSSNPSTRSESTSIIAKLVSDDVQINSDIFSTWLEHYTKERPAVELRLTLVSVLEALSDHLPKDVPVSVLRQIIDKEMNPVIYHKLVMSYVNMLSRIEPDSRELESTFEYILAKMRTKQETATSAWTCVLAKQPQILQLFQNSQLTAMLEILTTIWDTHAHAYMKSFQLGTTTTLLATTVILLHIHENHAILHSSSDRCHFFEKLTSPGSYLVDIRFLSRIAETDDILLATTSLQSLVLTELKYDYGALCEAWSNAFLEFLSHHMSTLQLRQFLLSCTKDRRQLVIRSAVQQLQNAIIQDESKLHSGLNLEQILTLFLAVVQEDCNSDSALATVFLRSTLFLAHHGGVRNRNLWTTMARLLDINLHTFVADNLSDLISESLHEIDRALSTQRESLLNTVSCTITTLAFVSPEDYLPLVVATIASDYNDKLVSPEIYDDGSVSLLQIYSTARPLHKNDLHNRVITSQSASAVAKPKSSQLDHGPANKLQSDTEDVQIKKERLHAELTSVRRALNCIRALNHSFISDSWIEPVIDILLTPTTITAKHYLDFGEQPVSLYLDLCNDLDRFGLDARMIGTASLALLEVGASDDQRDLLTRILYRIRSESERSALDHRSLAFALPLVLTVLSDTKVLRSTGCITDDQKEEQIFLALEIMHFNINGIARSGKRLELIRRLTILIADRPSHATDAKTILMELVEVLEPTLTLDDQNELLRFLFIEDDNARLSLLQSLNCIKFEALDFNPQLWLLMYDESEQVAILATRLFHRYSATNANTRLVMLPYLGHELTFIRNCAAEGIAESFDEYSAGFDQILTELFSQYNACVAAKPPEYDRFGQIIKAKDDLKQSEPLRCAIAYTLQKLASCGSCDARAAVRIVAFLFDSHESPAPSADMAEKVRQSMLAAGIETIKYHGDSALEGLLTILEENLEMPSQSVRSDHVKEVAVVLYGMAAVNLPMNDTRISTVIDRLLQTLSTPSESVQTAIGSCIPPLVTLLPEKNNIYIREMLSSLTGDKSYAQRRGAAYGLAGIIKGSGISCLLSCNVLSELENCARDKRNVSARQGALWAYELFARLLQNMFEPYVSSIIPVLLVTFADPDAHIRASTHQTARAIMSSISGYGVAQILPSLLNGLDDSQWRSKKGSIELIGAMSYCAPRQLAMSLPTLIPRLNEVLTDSHAQVRAAGNASLTQFGQVISNPEIKVLVPDLLAALSDPNKHIAVALDKLLKTSFLHYIDSPSLAVMVPILERGMQERTAVIKKQSAKIFGLMATLTNPNDLSPHLQTLVPRLRLVLADTVPDVRATAAKAFGSLMEKLGERSFPELVDELLGILNSDVASTDRQGAAQGLSEILAGLGVERLEITLPQILRDARSRLAYVREGFISLLIYLPATFGTKFAPYLARSISPILAGLADESEFVRDASLRAGRIMIANYATKSVDLMLPELEQGMFHESWRIRVSSLQLVGDLLFKVSGVAVKSNKLDEDDEDAVATEAQRNALIDALGQHRRDRILALVYITRFDAFGMVRSSAINVWKTLISNTPKTLKDILPSILDTIISNLALSTEKRFVYVEALGDLVKKMGSDLVAHILPAFETGLKSTSADQIGVCVAITELAKNMNTDQMEDIKERLLSAIRVVLIAKDSDVRIAANETFDALQTRYGSRIIDAILPELLSLLQHPDKAEEALSALEGLMLVRSQVILPTLLPTLLQRPMTAFNLNALASLVRVSGHALVRRLSVLLSTIMDAEIAQEAPEAGATFEAVLLSAPDTADSVATLMNILLELIRHQDWRRRAATCNHLAKLFSEGSIDISRYVSDWLRSLMILFSDAVQDVVSASWLALDNLIKSLRKEQMSSFVTALRSSVQNTCSSEVELPGFCLPKGLSAILPIYLQALLYGSAEQKAEAAAGLGELVQRTSEASLKGFVTQITGPLIRILGERAGQDVKSAILYTLTLLLEKVSGALRPFLPQLQRSFTKALADPSGTVRARASTALGSLITLQTSRLDPLVTELISGTRNPEAYISSAMTSALFQVIRKSGDSLSSTSKDNVISLITDLSATDGQNSQAMQAADLLGTLYKWLEPSQARKVLEGLVLVEPIKLLSINAVNGILLNSKDSIVDNQQGDIMANYLAIGIAHKDNDITQRSIVASGKFILDDRLSKKSEVVGSLISRIALRIESSPSNDTETQRLALVVIRAIARLNAALIEPHLPALGLPVFSCVRSMVLPVKLSAENAFVAIFQMTTQGTRLVDEFISNCVEATRQRSVVEYVKRVAIKKAAAEQERRAAGVDNREDEDLDEIYDVDLVKEY